MKNSFPGYYRPTDEEFAEMWKNCLFVLDANVLLNLYRYSIETRDELLTILEELSDRLWVPHQAALEYQQRRLTVIDQQASAYDATKDLLTDCKNKLSDDLLSLVGRGRHPTINVDNVLSTLTKDFEDVENDLEELKLQHPDLETDDPVRDSLDALLSGKVGSPYSAERQTKIFNLGKARYDEKIPPGYQDTNKGKPRQYGDLLIWFQIIDQAKETDQPVVFVTDDRKEDWWLKFKGRVIGPRPELVSEMISEAGTSFYMYSADPFLGYASEYLERQVNQQAIDEVREVRMRDERDMQLALAEQYSTFHRGIEDTLRAMDTMRFSREALDAIRADPSMSLTQDSLDAIRAALSTPISQDTLDAINAAVTTPIPPETLDAIRAASSMSLRPETLEAMRAMALLSLSQNIFDEMKATLHAKNAIKATQKIGHGMSKPSEEANSSEEYQDDNSN